MPRQPATPAALIDVTVVGGYLGAGKTTLVNHVLREADERVAVIVNDFGEINIDAELIESVDGDTMTLANGCICCSLVDGLAAALSTIAALEPRPERLLIEASGVADPASVAAYAYGPGMTLDAVVVVVDAETMRATAGDRYVGDTVVGQLAAADLLVVNKTDLAPADELPSLLAWLAERSPGAALVEAEHAAVPLDVLLGLATSAATARSTAKPQPLIAAAGVFEAVSWAAEVPVARRVIEEAMAAVPEGVVRVKGFVVLADTPDERHVLQRVGRRWTLEPAGPADGGGSRLVAIAHRGAVAADWLDRLMAPRDLPG